MAAHAYASGLEVDQFLEQVKWFCCGDDLIWSDNSGLFTPERLSGTYKKHGCYLTFSSLQGTAYEELTFVGTHPKERDGEWLYCYDFDRLRAKLAFHKKRATKLDDLAKVASACILMYADKKVFEELTARCYEMARNIGCAANGLIRAIEPDRVFKMYLEYESVSFFKFFLGPDSDLDDLAALINQPIKDECSSSCRSSSCYGGHSSSESASSVAKCS